MESYQELKTNKRQLRNKRLKIKFVLNIKVKEIKRIKIYCQADVIDDRILYKS